MSYFENIYFGGDQITLDAGGRIRQSQFNTLFDGQMGAIDRTQAFRDARSAATGTYSNNIFEMSVGSGGYYIRQSATVIPYFAGKSQSVEETFDNFQLQNGVVKRFGYFSSKATGTYDEEKDGWWIESNGVSGSFYLVASRWGTETHRSDWRSWDNYSLVSGTNWQNFNVSFVDFLWLGGAVFRFFLKQNDGFVLAHSYTYAGTSQNVWIRFPSQHLRYEIRGVSGAGTFRYICSQVSTEGSIDLTGEPVPTDTGSTAISLASSGVKYVVKAIRKNPEYRNVASKISNAKIFVASVDIGRWSIEINPNLSSALSYTNIPGTTLQEATGNGSITVSGTTRVLASGYLSQDTNIDPSLFEENQLAWMGEDVNGTQDQYVLIFTPSTTSVNAYGGIHAVMY